MPGTDSPTETTENVRKPITGLADGMSIPEGSAQQIPRGRKRLSELEKLQLEKLPKGNLQTEKLRSSSKMSATKQERPDVLKAQKELQGTI